MSGIGARYAHSQIKHNPPKQRPIWFELHIVPRVEKLRTAVIGAGVFGRLHMAKYRALDRVDLVAVADPSETARSAAELKYGVKTHADWRELKGVVDVVSICSPASTHGEIVRGFLEAACMSWRKSRSQRIWKKRKSLLRSLQQGALF